MLRFGRSLAELRHIEGDIAADARDQSLSAVSPPDHLPKKPKKYFNGIGKILSGAVAGAGNVLVGTGAIPATGGAAVAGGPT